MTTIDEAYRAMRDNEGQPWGPHDSEEYFGVAKSADEPVGVEGFKAGVSRTFTVAQEHSGDHSPLTPERDMSAVYEARVLPGLYGSLFSQDDPAPRNPAPLSRRQRLRMALDRKLGHLQLYRAASSLPRLWRAAQNGYPFEVDLDEGY